eukprot:jgi/Hompol1/6835/HPOL_002342-RA
MPQVHITGRFRAGGEDAVTLIELQGALDAQGIVGQDNQLALLGVHVGELRVDGDSAKLYIQNHVLEGKRVALSKPLVLLKGVRGTGLENQDSVESSDMCDIDDANNNRHSAGASSQPPQKYYDAVHIIRHKFHFKTRPEHVVSMHGLTSLQTPKQRQLPR